MVSISPATSMWGAEIITVWAASMSAAAVTSKSTVAPLTMLELTSALGLRYELGTPVDNDVHPCAHHTASSYAPAELMLTSSSKSPLVVATTSGTANAPSAPASQSAALNITRVFFSGHHLLPYMSATCTPTTAACPATSTSVFDAGVTPRIKVQANGCGSDAITRMLSGNTRCRSTSYGGCRLASCICRCAQRSPTERMMWSAPMITVAFAAWRGSSVPVPSCTCSQSVDVGAAEPTSPTHGVEVMFVE
mmetsp:Transcript_6072/g.21289  ORF Transcript_6072/g.21289 Transcript_6072/m.21289 type:complete len:250 (+) Transcript_6072:196-945(+)